VREAVDKVLEPRAVKWLYWPSARDCLKAMPMGELAPTFPNIL